MHDPRAFALLVFLNLTAGFIPSQTASLAAQQPSDAAQAYYIGINAQQSCPVSDCAEHLTAGNFAVLQDGRSYPLSLVRPSKTASDPAGQLPAHLLALAPNGKKRPKDDALVKAVYPVLEQGWMVSIERQDGTFTPYFADKSQLWASLTTAPAVLPGTLAERETERAVRELNAFPGLRMLLVNASKGQSGPSAEQIASVVKENVPVYFVDGGHSTRIYYDTSWGYSSSRGGPTPVGSDYITRRKPFDDDGILHEVKLDTAVSRC